jgi:hypothetical protein
MKMTTPQFIAVNPRISLREFWSIQGSRFRTIIAAAHFQRLQADDVVKAQMDADQDGWICPTSTLPTTRSSIRAGGASRHLHCDSDLRRFNRIVFGADSKRNDVVEMFYRYSGTPIRLVVQMLANLHRYTLPHGVTPRPAFPIPAPIAHHLPIAVINSDAARRIVGSSREAVSATARTRSGSPEYNFRCRSSPSAATT